MTDFKAQPTHLGANLVTQTEGTFTPSFTFATPGTSSFAYSSQSGDWIRTGKLVDFSVYVVTTSLTKGTGAGAFRLDLSGIGVTPSGRMGWGTLLLDPAQIDLAAVGGQDPIDTVFRIDPGTTYATMHYTSQSYAQQTVTIDNFETGGMTFWMRGGFRVA